MRAVARSWRWVWVAMGVVIAVRVAAIFLLGTYQHGAGAFEHAEIAGHLARGEGFLYRLYGTEAMASSHQAPAVPGMLAVCFKVAGIETPGAYLLAELWNVVLAGVGAWGVYMAARAIWDERVGLWAVWGFALYPALIYAVTRVQAVNWTIAFLPLAVACVVRAVQGRLMAWAAGAGVVLGIGALGEPILLAPVGMAVLILLGLRMWRQGLMVAGVLVVVLLPWTVRNVAVHGRVVLVKSTFWYVFWQGNNAHATGTDKLPVDAATVDGMGREWSVKGAEAVTEQARAQATSIDSTMPVELRRAVEAGRSEMEKMDLFRAASLEMLRRDPGHYVKMCAVRLGQWLWFDPTNPRAYSLAYRVPYLGLLALALGGGVLAFFRRGRAGYVAVMMTAALVMVHVLVITSARFRLPVEAMMMILAGVFCEWVVGKLGDRRREKAVVAEAVG